MKKLFLLTMGLFLGGNAYATMPIEYHSKCYRLYILYEHSDIKRRSPKVTEYQEFKGELLAFVKEKPEEGIDKEICKEVVEKYYSVLENPEFKKNLGKSLKLDNKIKKIEEEGVIELPVAVRDRDGKIHYFTSFKSLDSQSSDNPKYRALKEKRRIILEEKSKLPSIMSNPVYVEFLDYLNSNREEYKKFIENKKEINNNKIFY